MPDDVAMTRDPDKYDLDVGFVEMIEEIMNMASQGVRVTMKPVFYFPERDFRV